jgi:hypothetical protein
MRLFLTILALAVIWVAAIALMALIISMPPSPGQSDSPRP